MINGRIIVLIVMLVNIDEFVWLLSFFIVHSCLQTILDYLLVIHLQLFQLTLHVLYLIVNALEA